MSGQHETDAGGMDNQGEELDRLKREALGPDWPVVAARLRRLRDEARQEVSDDQP